jgi:pyruvate/2-oxoglutarate dehydrogenase complex dihydrolipoamide dehydrogenase (E3) component
MSSQKFDLVVIGSGSAGTSAVEAAREAGAKSIAIIDAAKRLGGECPNRGCVPTKALLRSIEVLMLSRRGREFGLKIPSVKVDFSAMMRRRYQITDALTGKGRIEKLLGMLDIELIRGRARFVGMNAVKVNGRHISARKFIIATGSEAVIPPLPGLDKAGYWTSDDVVELKRLPKSVIIMGGGPIGVEIAQILAPLGVKVTLMEYFDRLLFREEPEVSQVVMASLQHQGVKLIMGIKATHVTKSGRRSTLHFHKMPKGPMRSVTADSILVAAGKRPAVKSLDLATAGIALDNNGRPVLNAFLQTKNPAVYFAGDAAGQMLFTAVAHAHGEIAGKNAIKGNRIKFDGTVIPRGTFCFPEAGSVGMTEREAREKGFDVGVGSVPLAYFGKALVTGEMTGLVKIVVDKKTKKVLGGHVVGQSAAELVHEIALAIYAKIPYTAMANMIHAYPTFAEAVGAAAYAVE